MKLDKKGRRIEIRSATPLPGLKTTVPGAYETTSGYWTVPLSIESYTLLRERYGKLLQVSNELQRWLNSVRENRRSMAKLASASDARLTVLPKAAPKLFKAMSRRKYQRVGGRFVADNTASLVADEPGLGKTFIAMAGILEAEIPGPFLVVAPKTAADSVWRREITRWLPHDHRAIILPEMRYQREDVIRLTRYGAKTWLIVHPEIVMVGAWWECANLVQRRHKRTKKVHMRPCGKRTVMGSTQQTELDCGHQRDKKTKKIIQPSYPKLFEEEWGAVICDESHEILIRRKGVPTQRRRGMDMLPVRGDGMRLALSGTPWDSIPEQLWGTLNWLDSKTYPAYFRWAELYWEKGGYTGYQIGEFRKDREKMLWDSLNGIALRRTKLEVAKDMPPKTHVGTLLDPSDEDSPKGIWLPMEGKQEVAYREIEEAAETELGSGTLETFTALDELTRLKQLACAHGRMEYRDVKVNCFKNPRRYPVPCRQCKRDGYHWEVGSFFHPDLPSNKFNWIIESLEEWGYPKSPIDKVVIVSFYTGILNMMGRGINEHFSTKRQPASLCAAITGQTPSRDRRGIIDRFNEHGGPQIMLLNVKAGGTAITIDSADRMIFISETRRPDKEKQAEDRIHRISNPRNCFYYYLRSLGTVDIGTALINKELNRATRRLLDERRGVDYTREVIALGRNY